MVPIYRKMMGHPSMRLNVVSNSPPIDLVRQKVATNWPSLLATPLPLPTSKIEWVSREFSAATMFTPASERKGRTSGRTVESMHFIEASQKRHLMSCSKEGIGIYNLRDTLITTERVPLTEVFGAKQRCSQFRVWSTQAQYGVKIADTIAWK